MGIRDTGAPLRNPSLVGDESEALTKSRPEKLGNRPRAAGIGGEQGYELVRTVDLVEDFGIGGRRFREGKGITARRQAYSRRSLPHES
jgi:hypothetical protein